MQGWCKNNYHADGKRRYGFLTDGLCKECLEKIQVKIINHKSNNSINANSNNWSNKSNSSNCNSSNCNSSNCNSTIEAITKINEIIKEINESNKSASMIARKGLLEIDELGGYEILGYDTDKEYLEKEFPQLYISQLVRQRSCGRIEKLLGVPIGTYSYNKLLPLMQFRILVPCGGRKSLNAKFEELKTYKNQPFKENTEGIAKVKQAYQIAKKLAEKSGQNSEIPDGKYIEKAIAIMAEQGLAKKRTTPYHQTVNKKNKELAQKDENWLVIVAQKDQEINRLKAQINELEKHIKILSRNESSFSQIMSIN